MPPQPEDDPFDRLADERRPAGSRLVFQRQLAACDRRLVAVGGLAATMIAPVTSAFLGGDRHGAQRAIAVVPEISRLCAELEEIAYVLIARQSPVAGDLRHLVAVLRSVQDVQRSAMLLRHVAGSLDWIHPPSLPADLGQLLTQTGALTSDIFAGGVAAWEHHDADAAAELDLADDQVDFLQKCLLTDLYTGQQSVEEAVSLALVARYYERVADHGVEIARHLAYFVTGEHPRPARR
jgi:phosphate transport system protein